MYTYPIFYIYTALLLKGARIPVLFIFLIKTLKDVNLFYEFINCSKNIFFIHRLLPSTSTFRLRTDFYVPLWNVCILYTCQPLREDKCISIS